MKKQFNALVVTFALLISNSSHAEGSRWYLEPTVGFSSISDLAVSAQSAVGVSGSTLVEIDGGFVSGLTLGYRYDSPWAAELGWEYRSNDSGVLLPDGQRFDEGNYASNTFFLNGVYNFTSNSAWQPYIGAGLILVQEIDIDLENAAEEFSWSSSGDTGVQLFAGVNYSFSEAWSAQAELRYGSISGIDLAAEPGSSGSFTDFDYDVATIQLGLVYEF